MDCDHIRWAVVAVTDVTSIKIAEILHLKKNVIK